MLYIRKYRQIGFCRQFERIDYLFTPLWASTHWRITGMDMRNWIDKEGLIDNIMSALNKPGLQCLYESNVSALTT